MEPTGRFPEGFPLDSTQYEQLRRLFHELVEIPEPQRSLRVQALAVTQPNLQQDLEALLARQGSEKSCFEESQLGVGFELVDSIDNFLCPFPKPNA